MTERKQQPENFEDKDDSVEILSFDKIQKLQRRASIPKTTDNTNLSTSHSPPAESLNEKQNIQRLAAITKTQSNSNVSYKH
ncbi:uncharacterized protein LOC119692677 isoform X2 [Plutella xylostella]|uniref:uncharacterized protein LOC119692677 isoform X2 n=1 Tax=Plutella xylostella TaxID=51655 RepID=UPI002032387B|nr:uncharacterized protein LOC119692677 isoform X2 [Plutella xylostella]